MGNRPVVARGYEWRTGAQWGKGTICILIMVVATCIYASAKTHRDVHKREKVHFTV